MALLLTQKHIRQFIEGEKFAEDIFQVIKDALLSQQSNDPGHVSWLAFPLAPQGSHVNVNILTTSAAGMSIRVFPPLGGPIPLQDGYLALLFNEQDGALQALMATDDLSPLRTAAPIGLASRYLAPRNSTTLGILGSGEQARYQLRMLYHAVPSLKDIRVFSPTEEHRHQYAAEMRDQMGLPVEPVDSVQKAIQGADIICITASRKEPLFQATWVKPGALITNLTSQGLPPDLPVRLVAPARQGPVARSSGWDPWPVTSAANDRRGITPVTTLDEVIRNVEQVRIHADDVVLYEQRGVHVWDAALLRWIYNLAQQHQIGTIFHLSDGH